MFETTNAHLRVNIQNTQRNNNKNEDEGEHLFICMGIWWRIKKTLRTIRRGFNSNLCEALIKISSKTRFTNQNHINC